MRKLIVSNIMSLDGYVAAPDGNPMALPMDETFNQHCIERLHAADTLLLGANTYTMFHGFWPAVADNEEATPSQREISRLDNAIDKVVVSDGLADRVVGPWADSTRVLSRAEAHDSIAELKAQDGGDILTFGSITTYQDLLAAGLVDELHFLIGGTVLGEGVPAFTEPLALRRLETRALEGSDNILVRYAVDNG